MTRVGASSVRAQRDYHARMTVPSWLHSLDRAGRAPWLWLRGWLRMIEFGASMLVLALSASTYDAPTRRALARQVYSDTASNLAWFTLLDALMTVVITRIVVVTAQSYGLSRYAMEMVIRVLVIELIPLTAALFVAMRCSIPNGIVLSQMRRTGGFERVKAGGGDPLRVEILPRVLAGMFASVAVAAVSCAVALVVSYVVVYGATLAGIPAYTRMFGHVFSPAVTLIFALKVVAFSLAVGVMPMASAMHEADDDLSREGAALRGLVRLFAVLLLVEVASLVGNYY